MGKQWLTLFFWAPKSLQMVIAAMKLKDAYSLPSREPGVSGNFWVSQEGCQGVAPDPAESRGAPPPPQDPSPLRGTLGSSLSSPAEGKGHEGFPPPPDKDLVLIYENPCWETWV